MLHESDFDIKFVLMKTTVDSINDAISEIITSKLSKDEINKRLIKVSRRLSKMSELVQNVIDSENKNCGGR